MGADTVVRCEFVVPKGYAWRAAWADRSRRLLWDLPAVAVICLAAIAGAIAGSSWTVLGIGTALLALFVLLWLAAYLFVVVAVRAALPVGTRLQTEFGNADFTVTGRQSAWTAAYGYYRKLVRRRGLVGLVRAGSRLVSAFYPAELFPEEIRDRFGPRD